MSNKILMKLKQRSERCPLPGRWACLGNAVNASRLPPDRATLIVALREDFSYEELIGSNLFDHSDDGELQFIKAMDQNDGLFVPIWHAKDELPFDIIVQQRCIFTDALPILAGLSDRNMEKALRKADNRLFVVFDLIDLVLLNNFSLPVVLWRADPPSMPAQVKGLSDWFGWRGIGQGASPMPPSNQAAVGNDSSQHPQCAVSQLIFVNWSPAELLLHEPADARDTAKFLTRVERIYGCDFTNLGFWVPTEETLKDLQCGIGFEDKSVVRDILLTSVDTSTRPLSDHVAGPSDSTNSLDFIADRAAFRHERTLCRQGRGNEGHLRRALLRFKQSIEELVYEPAARAASSHSRADQRGLELLQAELMPQVLLAAASIHDELCSKGKLTENIESFELVHELCESFDDRCNTFLRVVRELRR